MVLLTSVLGVFIGWYALAYERAGGPDIETVETSLFWPLWLAVWTGLNGVFLSGDLFNIYVMLELIAMGAIALMVVEGRLQAKVAALRYLLAALVGSLTYLMGVAFLYAEYGMLDYLSLGEVVQPCPRANVALTLMVVGLLLKTPLFPLHVWLPAAYTAPSPQVGALLSAIVGKAAFYVLLRIWFQACSGLPTPELGWMLGVMASIAIIWGSVLALRQSNLKKLIAYSSVAQLGYLFLLFPLSTVATGNPGWMELAYTGTSYQLLAHALAKGSMFLAAGVAVQTYGTDTLSELKGLAERCPVTVFALALSGATLMGLPPSGGFTAKWLLLKATLAAGQWWWTLVLLGGGLLATTYVFTILGFAFAKSDRASVEKKPAGGMEWAALSMALSSILLGLWLQGPMRILVIGGIGAAP
jgi:formate hydrogenlyase subunit 3/multisubunit Na+/H+ antiporter MnhD subunit